MATPSNPDMLPQETRLGRTALRVNDLGEIVGFYRDVIGLSVLQHADTSAILGSGDTPLLVLEGDESVLGRHRSSASLYHNAFRVPSREALGDALVRIREQWQLSGASDHGVSEALYLTDPEGNGVEIYRDFPRENWPHTPEGGVRMTTRPLSLEPLHTLATGEATVPAGTDVGHVHLEVSSLERFREFYVDVVGFEVRATIPAAMFVAAGGYHHHIGANTWNHRSKPADGSGLSWFEVLLPEPEARDAVESRIADSQYTVTETTDGIAVTGPDDIEVRFRVEP